MEDLGFIGIAVLLGMILFAPSHMQTASSIIGEENFYEGGEEEDKPTTEDRSQMSPNGGRGFIFSRMNNFPRLRRRYGRAIVFLLDPINFLENDIRLSSIVSHYDWFEEVIRLAQETTIRKYYSIGNNLYYICFLGGIYVGYGERNTSIHERNFARNSRIYGSYNQMYRRLMSGVAGVAGAPSIERVYRTARFLLRLMRRFL